MPIRYELAIATGSIYCIRGDGDGAAAEFAFTVTRSAALRPRQASITLLRWRNAADISGGSLSGEIFFDVNEKEKTIDVILDNDTLRRHRRR